MDNMACDINKLFIKECFSPHMKKEKVEFPDGHQINYMSIKID